MSTPRYHVADIALVSKNEETGTGGFMIVPLIDENIETQIFPIYSRKKIMSANASLPKVLNEVIRLTSTASGLGKLHNPPVLRNLTKSTNSQQLLSGQRSQALANLSGLINCKSCSNIAQTIRPIKYSSSIAPKPLMKVRGSKLSSKTKCKSCMTIIDAEFKYCPSCGVIRRPCRASSATSDEPSSISSRSQKSSTRIYGRCMNKARAKHQKRIPRAKKEKSDNDVPPLKKSYQEYPHSSLRDSTTSNQLQALKTVITSPTLPIRSKGGIYDLEAMGDTTIPKEQLGPLFECPTCLRTFLAKSLAIHRRSCGHTLNFERRLLDDESFQPALSKLKKNSMKDRWRP